MVEEEGLSRLSQPSDSSTSVTANWTLIDAEFDSVIRPVHHRLSVGEICPSEAAEIFTSLLRAHLERYLDIQTETGNGRPLLHRTRRIETTVSNLRTTKNKLRKNRGTNPSMFFNALRAYNNCLRAKRSGDRTKSLRQEEKHFRQNPWAFAKKACNDVNNFDPSFDKTAALSHFANTASRDRSTYSSMPSWIHEVMPAPTEPALIPFDLSPITPSLVKRTLYSRSSNSSPGDDGVSYHHLKKMPSTHHYLATLFSKVLLENQEAPHPWSGARIKLIHKGGDTNIPSNFRPIALSSVVGKIFHKILATRLENFAIDNNIIDTSAQKGFLTNINGTMEHIFAISAIVQNAMENGLPLSITFLDLANAFGSISHQLIFDILHHCKLPIQFINYITSLYSKLSAYIKTKHWSTQSFKVERGVFQGDTLSPNNFRLVDSAYTPP